MGQLTFITPTFTGVGPVLNRTISLKLSGLESAQASTKIVSICKHCANEATEKQVKNTIKKRDCNRMFGVIFDLILTAQFTIILSLLITKNFFNDYDILYLM